MHVVSKYKHLASAPAGTQKGTAENWMGTEQAWEGYSAASQTTTSGWPICSGALMPHRAGSNIHIRTPKEAVPVCRTQCPGNWENQPL